MVDMVPALRLIIVAVLLGGTCDPAAARTFAVPLARVQVRAVLKDQVSGIAWTTMVEECRAIWSREGITVDWDEGDGVSKDLVVVLPVVFDDRELGLITAPTALGVTQFKGRTQRVVVSVVRARELVITSLDLGVDSFPRDIAVGRLLGRVVAHEIGHVLLMTTRHADKGLMRDVLTANLAGGPLLALAPGEREYLTYLLKATAGETRVR